VPAPTPKAAAEIYPANYWYSLMQVPPKEAFPMTVAPQTKAASGMRAGEAPGPPPAPTIIRNQMEWVGLLKCNACHQVGNKGTRELSTNLGKFDSSIKAWDRAMRSGQTGDSKIIALDKLGHERGLAVFADWSDRIAAGELPPAPPRPQGLERNVVITLWDFSVPEAFVHDVISTDRRSPTVNANGLQFASEWSQDQIVWVDPVKHAKGAVKIPLKNESERRDIPTWSPQSQEYPSAVWGDELLWNDPVTPAIPMMDAQGHVWFNAVTRKAASQPAFCKSGSNNKYAKYFPIASNTRGVDMYDPKTGEIKMFDLCFGSSHMTIGEDKDDTLYLTTRGALGGVGWVKARVLLETGDEEKAQGWCPAIIDYNGDGKIGAYTRAPEPVDPTLDRMIPAAGYGIAYNPVDKSVWYVAATNQVGFPGKIYRTQIGDNPPATCITEVYEPPYNNPKRPGVMASGARGIDVDRNGLVWTALSDSNQLASFDRRKCKVLNGPTATGQHCPEGWTLYPVPGPNFKGMTEFSGSDFLYYNWVDQFDTFGLGKNVSIVNGAWSDSLLALDPTTGKWLTMRVPYPLGFYSRGVNGRIDDPNTGWKGRGLWAANGTRVTWHNEGGKTVNSPYEKAQTSFMAHFQLRPDPLAH
jgi:streptogramin lyase